ncbi:hypothetical protein GCM10017608_21470 [Agromyces luteolus]|uniref:Uncharacterized protein n=1 Tax=Agromyces luteolus TaxID=88373 RepID=A0A7C9LGL3_9MICO|nr:hypothetical protein [Agromyces luteolus]MUN08850.1 hypothetical protein [Agromyces luteolus]GLK28213.1 hypothetical protein GCM10017608_21470 [Agromyces luteolus]
MSPALASAITLVAAAEEEFDPNDVTPGVVGFIATILIMVAVLLLVLDMVRRIRRVNYRAEAQERLAAEEAAAAEAAADGDVSPGDADAPQTDAAASETPPVDRDER